MALVYCKKQFLNTTKNNFSSVIVCSVDEDDFVNITITDCDNKVQLYGDLNDSNTVFKIDALIEQLDDLKEAINDCIKIKQVLKKTFKTIEIARTERVQLLDSLFHNLEIESLEIKQCKSGFKLIDSRNMHSV